MIIRGGCLCGAVAYEARVPIAKFANCYCSRCRKATGSTYSANFYVSPEAFKWTDGEALVVRYDLPQARRLCDFVLQQVRIAGAASYAERPRGRSPGWLAQ